MLALEITFEFEQENFSRTSFEVMITDALRDKSVTLENFWCFQGKRMLLDDYPIVFFVNECIIEILLSDRGEAERVFSIVEAALEEVGRKSRESIKISSPKYRVVSIWNNCPNEHENKMVFVTGANGQLGHDVMNRLFECGYRAIGSGRPDSYSGIQDGTPVTEMPYISMNITDSENVKTILEEMKPDVVIHCAAYNSVDRAEEKYAATLADSTNYSGSLAIAEACLAIDAKMMYISTDYVFDGKGDQPWAADAKSEGALNVYGQTKLEGETAVSHTLEKYFIVRTSWAYGINGNNFVKTMLEIGRKYGSVHVVDDQIGSPTYMRDLAVLIVDMIATDRYGFYNATNEGEYISWYDFACEIYRQAGMAVAVQPVSSEDYAAAKARRPMNSRLDKSKLAENGFAPLPDWKDALRRYLSEMGGIS